MLISLLPLNVVEDLPAVEPPIDPDNELQGISVDADGLCTIGSATTNEQFRLWCLAQRRQLELDPAPEPRIGGDSA